MTTHDNRSLNPSFTSSARPSRRFSFREQAPSHFDLESPWSVRLPWSNLTLCQDWFPRRSPENNLLNDSIITQAIISPADTSYMGSSLLLVDDDRNVLDVQRRILERESYTVDVTHDGSKAAEMAEKKNYDLVITDLMMPDFDGIELILRLRRSQKSIKVIATSGGSRFGTMSCLDAAKLCGAASTLMKPFSREELLDTVTHALQA